MPNDALCHYIASAVKCEQNEIKMRQYKWHINNNKNRQSTAADAYLKYFITLRLNITEINARSTTLRLYGNSRRTREELRLQSVNVDNTTASRRLMNIQRHNDRR